MIGTESATARQRTNTTRTLPHWQTVVARFFKSVDRTRSLRHAAQLCANKNVVCKRLVLQTRDDAIHLLAADWIAAVNYSAAHGARFSDNFPSKGVLSWRRKQL
jgi:hypothetical protein